MARERDRHPLSWRQIRDIQDAHWDGQETKDGLCDEEEEENQRNIEII
jgi:hypothetical protein